MPVLVWIKGEEPTCKASRLTGPATPWARSRHTWVGAKRQCWRYIKQNTTYYPAEWLLGVACVVFERVGYPNGKVRVSWDAEEFSKREVAPKSPCACQYDRWGSKQKTGGDNRLMKGPSCSLL